MNASHSTTSGDEVSSASSEEPITAADLPPQAHSAGSNSSSSDSKVSNSSSNSEARSNSGRKAHTAVDADTAVNRPPPAGSDPSDHKLSSDSGDNGEDGSKHSELVDHVTTIASAAPDDESDEGWTQLAAFLGDHFGYDGAVYKGTIESQLTKEAASVGWKRENSRAGILNFDPHHYENGNGEPRRGRTEVRMGRPAVRAAEICAELGVDVEALGWIVRAKKSSGSESVKPQEIGLPATDTQTPKALLFASCYAKALTKDFPLLRPLGWATWEDHSAFPRSPLTRSTGIEGATCDNSSAKPTDRHAFTAKIDTLLSTKQVGNGVPNKVNTAPQPPVIARRALQRQTCERSTIEAIYEHVPEAKKDKVLFRWVVYALWTNWRDKTTFRRVIHHEILDWIGVYRFDSAQAVLEYIREHLPIDVSDTWSEGEFTRQILGDGLPPKLWKEVQMDLDMSPADYDTRVYVLSGRVVTNGDPGEIRKELKEEVARMEAPSETSRRIRKAMNDLPPRRFDRFQDRISRALEYVDRMEIDVGISPFQKAKLRRLTGCEKEDDGTLTGNVTRYKARVRFEKRRLAEEQRTEYKQILHRIAHQHKPFYKPSEQERTDRVFSHNDSALLLPSEVRDTLCEGLYDVDLKSAHLLIAAWLWGAEEALKVLRKEGYSIWDDLMEHCRPLFEAQDLDMPEKGADLYEEVKAGMKVMVYSTVYGMAAPSIQAEVTKSLQHILGPGVGDHLTSHHVIEDIREHRDEVLEGLEPGDTLEAPTGIEIEVEVGLEHEGEEGYEDLVGPKSAVATQAQAYEQELMSVLLDVAEKRDRFRLMLWLHDGAACGARYPNALEKDVNEALEEKRKELTEFAGKTALLPALFEVEEIEAPELPPKDVGERIASAGGGVLRLKDGETAVRVDEETGEEIEPAGAETLLKREHELYKIAGKYVRITNDGYTIEPDPYPEEKLWEPLTENKNADSSPSSTNSVESQNQNQNDQDQSENQGENQSQKRSRTETAPGAESHSKEKKSPSPGSDMSTTSAPPASPRTAKTKSRDPLRHLPQPRREAIREESRRIAERRAENPEPDLSAEEAKRLRAKAREPTPPDPTPRPRAADADKADPT